MKRKYVQSYEGEPIAINLRKRPWPHHAQFRAECCDCSLVHIYKFKILDKGATLLLSGWRDNRATAARRRWNKKKPRK
jgi:hypothetical protein